MKYFETLDSPVHSHFHLREHTKPNTLDLDPSLGLGPSVHHSSVAWDPTGTWDVDHQIHLMDSKHPLEAFPPNYLESVGVLIPTIPNDTQ